MKNCPKCAESIRDDAKVCRFCGYDFVKAEKVRNRNVFLGTAFGAILFLCGLCFLVGIVSDSSKNSSPSVIPTYTPSVIISVPTNTDTVLDLEPTPYIPPKCALRLDAKSAEFSAYLYVISEGDAANLFCYEMKNVGNICDGGICSSYSSVEVYPEHPVICSISKNGLSVSVVDEQGIIGEAFCSGLAE